MPDCIMSLATVNHRREGEKFATKSFFGAMITASALFTFSLLDTAFAAMPGRVGDNFLSSQEEASTASDAAAIISGSPSPGIIDCSLQRHGNAGASPEPDIFISYPSIGNARIDEDIREWVTGLADAFSSHLNMSGLNCPLDTKNFDAEAILNMPATEGTFELWGQYKVTRPSRKAISIAFELWNYTGSPEANLDILTLNYSLFTGQRLGLVDIFEKPDVALELMSRWSRKVLEPRLGAARRTNMLVDGTEPLVENFSSITLTPEGICINFQPWQVAPKDAGIQRVEMPLAELMPSSPLLALWGK